MYELILFLCPYLLGFLAFVSAFRAFLWVSDKVEMLLPDNFKRRSIVLLDTWWISIKNSEIPFLAEREASFILNKLVPIFSSREKLRVFEITGSLILTTSSYLIGHCIFIYSHLNGPDVESQRIIWFYSIYFPSYIYLIVSSFRLIILDIWNKKNVYRVFVKFVLITASIHIIHHCLGTYGFQIPDILRILCIIAFIAFANPIFKLENDKYSQNYVILTLLLMFFFANHLFYFVLSLVVLYWVNYLFDRAVLHYFHFSLKKIGKNSQVKNIAILISNIVVAFALALPVFFLIIGSWGIRESGNLLPNLEFLIDLMEYSPITLIENQYYHTINYNAFCIFLYSTTLFVPILIFSIGLVVRFVAKLIYLYLGQVSRFLFYRNKRNEKKSVIYLSLVLIFFWLSFLPAFFAFYSSQLTVLNLLNS